MELLTLDLGNGEKMFFEAIQVREEGTAVPAAAPGSLPVEEVISKLRSAMAAIALSGRAFLDMFNRLETDEATVRLGIGFTAEGNAIITKAGASVNFEITLTWKKSSVVLTGQHVEVPPVEPSNIPPRK